MKKNILLGITGSIAAYKAAYLVRLFVKNGYDVKVIMTESATEFISPLTLSTLSKNPVLTEFATEGQWHSHVELGLWADLFLIAPVTANTIAKMNTGIADNLLLTTFLSAKCPVIIAPAMDLDMWKHPVTQSNIKGLKQLGIDIIEVENGELASGLVGEGRMAEPEIIFDYIDKRLKKPQTLANKKVLITAGPTYENIDPVRFIGNRSTGKMGIALAGECVARGADVTLVLGPVKIEIPPNINVVRVQSAEEMANAVFDKMEDQDIFIMAAAVADYTPKNVSDVKIKKASGDLVIELKRTIDIAKEIGAKKTKEQLMVGFALETDFELENAKKKLSKKNFDMIVLNSLKDKGAGFGYDTNKVTIISSKGNKISNFELKSKKKVAIDILDELENIIYKDIS